MVFYEDVLTIGREAELFWGQRITAASVLFFLNRYFTLINAFSNFTNINDAQVSSMPRASERTN